MPPDRTSVRARVTERLFAWLLPIKPIRLREDALTALYARIDSRLRREALDGAS